MDIAERILLNISLLLFIWIFYKKTRHGMHMLQLESYHNDRYIRWMKKNIKRVVKLPEIIMLLIPTVLICLKGWIPAFVAYIFEILFLLVISVFTRKKKEKKAFVVTGRIKRMFIIEFIILAIIVVITNLTNSIVAIILVNVLLLAAYFMVVVINLINLPIVNLSNKKFTKMAVNKLESIPDMTIIGITGSYGKTTTKNVVNTILSQKYDSLMTPGSFNTPLGVVRTINEYMKPTNNVFVCEMGAKYVGDIKEICDIVHPQIGILTAIGPQHLDTFKSLENVRQTKLELIDSLPEDGVAFVNWEDSNIRESEINCKTIIKYGLNDKADYYAKNIEIDEQGSSFDVVIPNKEPIRVKTKLLGRLNILNIVCGVAVADYLGLTENEIKAGTKFIKPVEHRLQMRKNPNGSIIIDDAYNSNIRGAKMALEVLKNFEDKKRLVITPGIVDLGTKADEINEELGEYIADSADYVILVGKEQAKPIYKGLSNKKYPDEKICIAENLQEALDEMKKEMTENTVILLENDLPDNYL